MSATKPSPAPAAPRRARAKEARRDEEIMHGAPDATLDRPAGELLESIPWEGPAPDPDALPAQVFLSWL